MYPISSEDIDVLGEMIIHRRSESIQGVLRAREEVDDLSLGMSAGISAAGAPDPGFFTGEPEQGLFQLPLNRRLVGLKLETGVPGALVFNEKGGSPKLSARFSY